MRRISVCWLALVFLVALASAYMVHEEPLEEIDKTIRGKRQQNDVAVINDIFNIPEISSKAASELIKIKHPTKHQETLSLLSKSETSEPEKNYYTTVSSVGDIERRYRLETKKRVEAQREQQRFYDEQLRHRRLQLVLEHNKRMQDQIVEEDKRPYSHIYRDAFGFNALTEWVAGPRGIFKGHVGHGDGHVYQFFNEEKPLHFGGHRDYRFQQRNNDQNQEFDRPIPAKSTLPLSSTITVTSSNGITSTSTTSPTHNYEVHEVIDEGINPFTWPNWFGIINTLGRAVQIHSNDRAQSEIDSKETKVELDDIPLQNKITPNDEDHYKSKYAQTKKNYNTLEAELTGNEIDGDLESNENRLTLIK